MNRTEFKKLVEDCGGDKVAVRQSLEAYFDTPEGQKDLEDAPRSLSYVADGDGVSAEETTKGTAIRLLMQEV
jgi:hypothetical protein